MGTFSRHGAWRAGVGILVLAGSLPGLARAAPGTGRGWQGPTRVLFVQQDRQRSTVVVSDAAGTVVSRRSYQPFGAVQWGASSGTTDVKAGFQAQTRDLNELVYW